MSIRIEVKSPEVLENSGTSNKTGKAYTIRKQKAYAYTMDETGKPNEYPDRIEIQLDRDQPAFPIGNYTIAPTSFFVGDFNALALGRLKLQPLQNKVA